MLAPMSDSCSRGRSQRWLAVIVCVLLLLVPTRTAAQARGGTYFAPAALRSLAVVPSVSPLIVARNRERRAQERAPVPVAGPVTQTATKSDSQATIGPAPSQALSAVPPL